jgi:hypothetical protein
MLTNAQKIAWKADLIAQGQAGQPLDGIYNGDQTDWNQVVAYYNGASGQIGWQTQTPVVDILNSITWTSFTPVDAADSTATYTNRLGVINIKQMNLQNLLFGRTTLDCSLSGIRSALRDCVIALPAGTAGANVSAGGSSGVNVLTACTRAVTRLENLFVTTTATTGTVTAYLFPLEYKLSVGDAFDFWSNY